MAAFTDGMNIPEVRQMAKDLGQVAERVEMIVRQLDGRVSSTTWVGKDAREFKSQWWPQHQVKLRKVVDDLRGYGTSANSNADDQERASTTGASGALQVLPGGGGLQGDTVNPQGGNFNPQRTGGLDSGTGGGTDGGSVGANGSVGGSAGSLDGSGRSWQEVQQAYEQKGPGYGLGSNAPGGRDEYQCVAWAKFRARELGFMGGFPEGELGNGGAMAGNMGGSADTPPTLGAIASNPDVYPPWGHVMVVEEVTTGAGGEQQIRVSEMNTGRGVLGPGIDGHPDEYKSDNVYTRGADGIWKSRSGSGRLVFKGLR